MFWRTSEAITLLATVSGLGEAVASAGLAVTTPLLLTAGIVGLGSLAAHSERWREVATPASPRDR